VRYPFCEYVHGRAVQQGSVEFSKLERQILRDLEPHAVRAGRWDAVHAMELGLGECDKAERV